MSMEPWEAEEETALDRLYSQFGPEWAVEHGDELYDDAIRNFTSGLLRSYYVANPSLAMPAHDSLAEANILLPLHPKAAIVLSTTAIELTIKAVLLQPIVFGLVHTEALAELVTDLTMQHAGMERFQALLTEILKRFGGVDLRTFTRQTSTKTLWQELGEVQKARNKAIHRGEVPDKLVVELSLAVASTLLTGLFPEVLKKLDLHVHGCVVCAQKHFIGLQVTFTIPGHPMRTPMATVNVDGADFDLNDPPRTISGALVTDLEELDLTAMRSAPSEALMHVVSLPLKYQVEFEAGSTKFTGTKRAWN